MEAIKPIEFKLSEQSETANAVNLLIAKVNELTSKLNQLDYEVGVIHEWKIEQYTSDRWYQLRRSAILDTINPDMSSYYLRQIIEYAEAYHEAKLKEEIVPVLKSVNSYFVDLQNKCALTNSDERAWKLVSKLLNEKYE